MKTYDELTIEERNQLPLDELLRLLNEKMANIPRPAHLMKTSKPRKASKAKLYDNYLLPQHRNV